MRLRYYHYTVQSGLKRIKTKVAVGLSTAALGIGALGLTLGLVPGLARADSQNINFESPSYTIGNINGQDGWTATGSAGSGCAVYDEGVANNTSGSGTFSSQSFRISDAVTSGCFGDQAFAKPLNDSVGETSATASTYSVGTKQTYFVTQFDIASATPNTQQLGLHISVSPDRGDGSRMSYLRFEDQADGIHVFFDDVTSTGTPGSDQFNETDIATLNRAVPHTVKLAFKAVDGPSNDVVKVWIDGSLVKTGTSWEDYYRFDAEASAEQSPRIVKTVLFRAGGDPTPADAGKGFLFDNLTLQSLSSPTVSAPTITTPANNSTQTSAQLVKVDWTDATGTLIPPVTYQYRAFSDAGYSALVYDSGNTLTASEIPTPGTANGTYYVQVKAFDSFGNSSTWSNDTAHPYKITVANAVVVAQPTNEKQCKKDGWKSFNAPAFASQKDCLKWVNAEAHGDLRMSDPRQRIEFTLANTKHGDGDRDEHQNAKTTVEYWNFDYPGGLHYKAVATCVNINPLTNDARFMFQIPAGHPGLSDLYVVAYVKQGGKHQPDLYGHAATADLATAQQWCQTGVGFTPTMYSVTKGNVEVE